MKMTCGYFILYLATVALLFVLSRVLKGRMQRWCKVMLKVATVFLVKE